MSCSRLGQGFQAVDEREGDQLEWVRVGVKFIREVLKKGYIVVGYGRDEDNVYGTFSILQHVCEKIGFSNSVYSLRCTKKFSVGPSSRERAYVTEGA